MLKEFLALPRSRGLTSKHLRKGYPKKAPEWLSSFQKVDNKTVASNQSCSLEAANRMGVLIQKNWGGERMSR